MTDKTLKGLFLSHRRELQAYLTQKLRDADVAADLTQEAFLRIAEQNSSSSAAVANVRSYLYRTAHNLAVDHVRQKARQKTDNAAHEDMESVPDQRPSLEDEADARQRLDRLRSTVAELPDRTRQIFVLNRIEGLSYAETAERLGISESSVQKHLAKALAHITKRLRPH